MGSIAIKAPPAPSLSNDSSDDSLSNAPDDVVDAAITLLRRVLGPPSDDRGAVSAFVARAFRLLEAERQSFGGEAGPDAEPATRGGLAPWQASRVRTHIEAHIEAPITVAALAALAGLSAGHFSRRFKETFGVTPGAYRTERQLQRASDLLINTDSALCDIALQCGFCDQAHFSRRFRQGFGVSPGRWRHEHRRDWPRDVPAPRH